MAAAAPTLKRVFLELGGKSAFVVLDDADLAAACGFRGLLRVVHAGQGCALTTRILLPSKRYDEGRLDEEAPVAVGPPATAGERSAVRQCPAQISLDPVALPSRDQRTAHRAGIGRVTGAERRHRVGDDLHALVVPWLGSRIRVVSAQPWPA